MLRPRYKVDTHTDQTFEKRIKEYKTKYLQASSLIDKLVSCLNMIFIIPLFILQLFPIVIKPWIIIVRFNYAINRL